MNWALLERTVELDSRTLALVDGHTVRVITMNGISRTNRSQISIDD